MIKWLKEFFKLIKEFCDEFEKAWAELPPEQRDPLRFFPPRGL